MMCHKTLLLLCLIAATAIRVSCFAPCAAHQRWTRARGVSMSAVSDGNMKSSFAAAALAFGLFSPLASIADSDLKSSLSSYQSQLETKKMPPAAPVETKKSKSLPPVAKPAPAQAPAPAPAQAPAQAQAQAQAQPTNTGGKKTKRRRSRKSKSAKKSKK